MKKSTSPYPSSSTAKNIIYNSAGNVSSWLDNEGALCSVTRNATGNPVTIKSSRSGFPTRALSFSYSATGKMTGITGDLESDMIANIIAEVAGASGVKVFASITDRPTAAAFGNGLCHIAGAAYQIFGISNSTVWKDVIYATALVNVPAGANGTVTLDNGEVYLFVSGVNQGLLPKRLILAAGTTVAGTAPLKLTTQVSPLTTPEQGTFELVGKSLQFTQLAKRRGVMMSQSTLLTDTIHGNTIAESAPITLSVHGANYLEVGKMFEIRVYGDIQQRSNPAAILTANIKYAGIIEQIITTLASTVIPAGTQYVLRIVGTCRTIGVTGTMQLSSSLDINGQTTIPAASALITIDTTTAQSFTLTFQWGEANVADTITVNQGCVICIEPDR